MNTIGISFDIDTLEAYIMGDKGLLCALPDIEPEGLVNDWECRPYPVLICDMNTMEFSITEAGRELFNAANDCK